jgi:putative flippase GtrA
MAVLDDAPEMKAWLRDFVRFAMVGAVATAVHFAILVALKELAHWHPVAATLIGYAAGTLVSYTLNRAYTFSVRPAFGVGMAKYLVVVLIGAGINALIVWALVSLHVQYMLAQCVATGLVLIWNFLGAKLLVFRA